MIWTDTRPTASGWYWVADECGSVRVVRLSSSRLPDRPGLRVVECGISERDAWPLKHAVYRGALWAPCPRPVLPDDGLEP